MFKLCSFSLLIFLAFGCKHKSKETFDRFPAGKSKELITIGGINVPDKELEIGLFAAEPDVFNPTNMDIDHKGRVWICEAYNYRNEVNNIPYEKKGDKIVILEDLDGDGKADTSKIFYQGEDVNSALGLCVLGNKVIVSSSPYVFVFTDENGDDIPEKKEILFKTIGGHQNDHGVHAVVFGPDGKLYFSFGNYVEGLVDAKNQPIKDIYGRKVKSTPGVFQDGMVIRCDLDAKNFEVLGSNFRNNYELCIDSYGRMWQADNDDDGVRSNRINYVLPYGNYGYKDEMTGADWRAYRTNKEDSVYNQHWHQNDPGVVPNLKILGAGSPTGIFVYEGNLLPNKYMGSLFLGDAYNNDVIAYKVHKNENGYTVENQILVDASEKDQWFRPSDVTAGSDGSVFIADWYDTAVGGHFVGDLERGRIYRVFPKGTKGFNVPKYDFNDINSCIEALKNPSNSVRYLAYTSLKKMAKAAESSLYQLAKSKNPIYAARAIWLLKDLDKKYIEEFSFSPNEDIRAATVRMAKPVDNSVFFARMAKDKSEQVQQTVATQIYHTKNLEAWITLVNSYKAGDRWFLEALGIGAKGNWDTYLEKYLENKDWQTQSAAKDIIWRSRAKNTSQYLKTLIENATYQETLRYFRAFDFQDKVAKDKALLELLEISKDEERKILIFKHFDAESIQKNPAFQRIIPAVLKSISNEKDFLDIVKKYDLKDQKDKVLSILDNSSDPASYLQAAMVATELFGITPLKEAINQIPLNEGLAIKRIQRLGTVDNDVITKQLILVFSSKKYPFKMREAAVLAMEGYMSDVKLWNLMKVNKITKELIPAAKTVLRKTFHNDIKIEFEHKFGSNDGVQLTEIPDFSSNNGNAVKGKELFVTMCSSCHKIGELGIDFGPGLSQIGKKLTPEGIYNAVVYPNQGINLGYETSLITFKDGSTLKAIITSKAGGTYLIKTVGSSEPQTYKAADIQSVEVLRKESLMPSFPLSKEQMLDLVSYLSSLK